MVVNEGGFNRPSKNQPIVVRSEGDQTGRTHGISIVLSGELSANPPNTPLALFGGILAEEPGLGKTVEMITLILLNPAPPGYNPTSTRWDPQPSLEIKAVKVSSIDYSLLIHGFQQPTEQTTLIVTPPSLAGQWKEEFEKHAPSSEILMYDGGSKVEVPITKRAVDPKNVTQVDVPKAKGRKEQRAVALATRWTLNRKVFLRTPPVEIELCHAIAHFRAWIRRTYPTLRSDLYVAYPHPKRPRRTAILYERPRSPLVKVWKRVVMEAEKRDNLA